jgi:hypothetical protein
LQCQKTLLKPPNTIKYIDENNQYETIAVKP